LTSSQACFTASGHCSTLGSASGFALAKSGRLAAHFSFFASISAIVGTGVSFELFLVSWFLFGSSIHPTSVGSISSPGFGGLY
jgi:hypothetical protein